MPITDNLLDPAVLALLIPVLGILVGGTIAILSILIRHRERMAMIDAGMHPDRPEEKPVEAADGPSETWSQS